MTTPEQKSYDDALQSDAVKTFAAYIFTYDPARYDAEDERIVDALAITQFTDMPEYLEMPYLVVNTVLKHAKKTSDVENAAKFLADQMQDLVMQHAFTFSDLKLEDDTAIAA